MRGAGDVSRRNVGGGQLLVRHRPPDRLGAQSPGRQVERLLAEHLTGDRPPPKEAHHPAGHLDRAEGAPSLPPVGLLLDLEDADVARLARRGGVVGISGGDERDPFVQIQLAHEVGVALVDVDGPAVHGAVGGAGVDRSEQAPGSGLHDTHGGPAGAPDVDQVGGPVATRPEPSGGAPPQQVALGQLLEDRRGRGPEEVEVGLAQGELRRGGAEVGCQHIRVVRVEHGRFDRAPENRLGMVHQERVERVVAGHQDGQSALSRASRTPCLLPEGGPRARPPGQHHGVEAGDVHAEFEGVRRRHTEHGAGAQGGLELQPVLREITGPVRRDPAREVRVDIVQQAAGGQGDDLGPAPGPHESQRAGSVDHEVGQQVRGLRGSRPAYRCAVLSAGGGQRGLPRREDGASRGRAVVRDRYDVRADEAGGRDLRLGHGRGGEHEHGRRAVARAHPPQPAEHRRDVRSEHSPVVVALVDDHVAQPAQVRRPPRVAGEHVAVQHVGVGEDVRRVRAHPLSLLRRGVPVVRRGAQSRQLESLQRPQLVVGESLGRGEVEGGRPTAAGRR